MLRSVLAQLEYTHCILCEWGILFKTHFYTYQRFILLLTENFMEREDDAHILKVSNT